MNTDKHGCEVGKAASLERSKIMSGKIMGRITNMRFEISKEKIFSR
jgi:hypothetical protein